MKRNLRLGTALLACALCLGSARASARADGPAGDEPSFLAAIEDAKRALSSGRAVAGLKMVQDVLEQNRGQDYVFAKVPEIEDLARRLSFRAECPPPDPKTLVKGDLKKFVSTTGDMEIRYKAGGPTDLESRDGNLVFPAHFRGPFTISIRGDAYPDTPEASPIVQVGGEENPKTRRVQMWGVVFGVPPFEAGSRKVWLPSRIVYVDGTEKKTIVEKETSTTRPGHAYRVDAQMTLNRVVGSIDGMPFGSAPKPDGVYGFAMFKATGWTEIVISGLVEPSWIQRKIDAIVDQKRTQFDAKFDLHKLLPSWLYDTKRAPKPTAPPTPRIPAGLAKMPPELLAQYLEAVTKLHAGDADAALAAAEALRVKGAPDSVTGVLAAQALVALEQPSKAIVEADRALAADPDAFDAFLLKGGILLRLGRDDDLAACMKAATARPGAGTELYQTAGFFLLLAGRLDDARAVVEAATRGGHQSPSLEAMGRVTVRARNGPDWPKSFEYKSPNYHVVSDIDPDVCKKAAGVLEDALVTFRSHVRSLSSEPGRRYKVFLFSGEAGFKRYVADSDLLSGKGPERAAGLYSPVMKQLLIWNLPNRDEMYRTIRHEGFHQYLDRLLPDPPVWLNEGMAVYFEPIPRPGGELRLDQARPDMMDALKGATLVPLKDFLRIRPSEFYATAPRSYAQAWLLVHMMRHGATKDRALYTGLLSHLEKESGPEAVRAVFTDDVLGWLDGELRSYLGDQAKRK